MAHLLDPPFFGMPGAEHYRHQTFPDSFLNGKEIRIENWTDEDIEMFITGLPNEKK